MQIIGENISVQKMYSEVSPYPGQFIRLLKDTNVLRQGFYSFLAKRKMFNQKTAYALFSSLDRFNKFCPQSQEKLDILDVGCGTGEVSLQLGLAFPNSKITGVDSSLGSLEWAKKLKDYFGINNVTFTRRDFDSEPLVGLGKFDLIHCCGVLHHLKNPDWGMKHMTEVLKSKESTLWIFLYANFGRHLENIVRKGIRMVIPDDNMLPKRANLAKELGYDRRILSLLGPIAVNNAKRSRAILKFRWTFQQFMLNLKDFGFYRYADRLENTDIFDAFAHPIVRYYDAKMVKELAEVAGLDLVSFRFYPHNQTFEDKIAPLVKNKDIYSQMETMECFHYPQSLYLNFRKK